VNPHLLRSSGYINGEWTDGTATDRFKVINPANGDEIISLPSMKSEDLDESADAAWKGFQRWKKTTCRERSRILKKMHSLMGKYSDDLAKILSLEAGKPLAEARVSLFLKCQLCLVPGPS
jgi:acyl-CoA reductase-like NAD-dependent aldehyde dehydrogenase